MGMHILIARLDMIVLLTQPEPLTEIQQFEIQKYLRLNKSLFTENQIDQLIQLIHNKNYENIRNLYLRRFARLEELLSLDLSIEQIYDYCIRVYLKEIKKSGTNIMKTYNNIIETHRLQQSYFLKEPSSYQNHYNCLDLEQDESNKYLLLSSLYNRNRFEEPQINLYVRSPQKENAINDQRNFRKKLIYSKKHQLILSLKQKEIILQYTQTCTISQQYVLQKQCQINRIKSTNRICDRKEIACQIYISNQENIVT